MTIRSQSSSIPPNASSRKTPSSRWMPPSVGSAVRALSNAHGTTATPIVSPPISANGQASSISANAFRGIKHSSSRTNRRNTVIILTMPKCAKSVVSTSPACSTIPPIGQTVLKSFPPISPPYIHIVNTMRISLATACSTGSFGMSRTSASLQKPHGITPPPSKPPILASRPARKTCLSPSVPSAQAH